MRTPRKSETLNERGRQRGGVTWDAEQAKTTADSAPPGDARAGPGWAAAGPLPITLRSYGTGGCVILQKDQMFHLERRPPHYAALRLSPFPAHETQTHVRRRRDATGLTADVAVCDRPQRGPQRSEEPRGRAPPATNSRLPRV